MSTLLADTIRKTGGTAGVDIRVKNNSVYETDGGTSVTQNMVQSLLQVDFLNTTYYILLTNCVNKTNITI